MNGAGNNPHHKPLRILLAGATGTIGRATLRALQQRRHEAICIGRMGAAIEDSPGCAVMRHVDFADPATIIGQGFCNERFDAVISCMASRSGIASDAWAVDYAAHRNLLAAAQSVGAGRFVLLSSICVQKPLLPFQQAKLAFEDELVASGMPYAIVRPTAYFKSLSGQVERVKKGKSFLLFGDGKLTACKPVSDRDLAEFLADCAEKARHINRILPIGGPGEAITPLQQGEMLFRLLGEEPRFRHVPVRLFDLIAASLAIAGRVSAKAAQKAELARIGRYYATESMLLLDPSTGRYDAAATPSIGSDTLEQHYRQLISGQSAHEISDHSMF